MDLLMLPLVVLALWKLEWKRDGFYNDGLSLEKTKALRGILALLVVLHHLHLYSPGGYLGMVYDLAGILCVTLFFFLSGYGLEKSARSKAGYGRRILTKRIPAILVPYLAFTGIYRLGFGYSLKTVLQGFVNGFPIVANAWYIHCLLAFYLSFALGQRLFSGRFGAKLLWHLGFAVGWVWLCRWLKYPPHWYNAVIAFPMGIFWAEYERKIRGFLEKRYFASLAVCAAAFLGVLAAALWTADEEIVVTLFWLAMGLFVVVVYLVLMKLTVKNPLLLRLGEISFEIYGIHGFFLSVYRSNLCFLEGDLLWGGAVLLSSVAAGGMLHGIFRRLLK